MATRIPFTAAVGILTLPLIAGCSAGSPPAASHAPTSASITVPSVEGDWELTRTISKTNSDNPNLAVGTGETRKITFAKPTCDDKICNGTYTQVSGIAGQAPFTGPFTQTKDSLEFSLSETADCTGSDGTVLAAKGVDTKRDYTLTVTADGGKATAIAGTSTYAYTMNATGAATACNLPDGTVTYDVTITRG